MTALDQLTHAPSTTIGRLIPIGLAVISGLPGAAKFDNRPTWDNAKPTFDNRPSWDNWNKH